MEITFENTAVFHAIQIVFSSIVFSPIFWNWLGFSFRNWFRDCSNFWFNLTYKPLSLVIWKQIFENKKSGLLISCCDPYDFWLIQSWSVSNVEGLQQDLDWQTLFPPHAHSDLLEAGGFWLSSAIFISCRRFHMISFKFPLLPAFFLDVWFA